MSRVTVIGGTGYAGSAIVAEAAARGHRVTAADYALGFVDLIEKGEHHREQVNLAGVRSSTGLR
ncbi:hypothetical protein KBX71_15230 [Micromonospora sp. D93]|uniref:hypothetical protein n=1 Tax=Micromonospora sp. D93 TaxID=2824886 RepID=UPI001B37B9ED|nr:hypothetical protein [Micromonospora sp. D93]MBQ1019209.1 hypothetical protein [Micromonospora sp. D93]